MVSIIILWDHSYMRSVVEQNVVMRRIPLYQFGAELYKCETVCSSDLRKAPHSASIRMRTQLCAPSNETCWQSDTPTCALLPATDRPGQAAFCILRRFGMSHPRCVRRVHPDVSRGSSEDTMIPPSFGKEVFDQLHSVRSRIRKYLYCIILGPF